MERNPKISIIIPVYNVDQYLSACLSSVLSQSLENIEVLLVDDGSSDGSALICDKYSEKDSRVRVFHKNNGGVSSARQYGLERAQGKWVLFVDADDYLPRNAIECLYSRREDADIVLGNIADEFGKISFKNIHSRHINNIDWLRGLLNGKYHSGPVAKLIRKECIESSFFRMPRDIVYAEDLVTNVRLAFNCKVVITIPDIVYVYRKNQASISHTFAYSLAYGEKVYSLVVETLKQHAFPEHDKNCKAFFLNVMKHVADSGEYDKNNSFVKSVLSTIHYRDIIKLKDWVWLFIFRFSILYRLYKCFGHK